MGTVRIPVVIENSSIPKYLSVFIDIGAITLWPFIIGRNKLNEQTLNHEKIHIKQQQELLLVGFYLLYIYYWLKGVWIYRDFYIAYHSIPFEQEAYDYETDMGYLKSRKRFTWWNYR